MVLRRVLSALQSSFRNKESHFTNHLTFAVPPRSHAPLCGLISPPNIGPGDIGAVPSCATCHKTNIRSGEQASASPLQSPHGTEDQLVNKGSEHGSSIHVSDYLVLSSSDSSAAGKPGCSNLTWDVRAKGSTGRVPILRPQRWRYCGLLSKQAGTNDMKLHTCALQNIF